MTGALRLAVLADPHLHDVADGALVRSLMATRRSTRVFNESRAALVQALDEIAAEGIRLVVVPGDLTDDGQPEAWAAAVALLDGYAARYGMRFFLTPGNHDQWGTEGRALRKERVDCRGDVHPVEMRTVGFGEMLQLAAGHGYAPQPGDLLWETPGVEGDASYLVEPVPGLWLLSLDANVYLPTPEGVTDCSGIGWIGALEHKPWLVDWIAGVVARSAGKRLVAFSHYPMVDVFRGVLGELNGLTERGGRRQMPGDEVARALAGTGLGLHFSGHWHVAASAHCGGLLNVAVPSVVAFPAGWTVVELGDGAPRIETRWLRAAPGYARWAERHRAEAALTGQPADLAEAAGFPAFLARHFEGIVLGRRLAEDWPGRMAELVDTPLSALVPAEGPAGLTLGDALVDWYRLREAGGSDGAGVCAERRALYRRLADGVPQGPDGPLLAVFFGTLGRLLGESAVRPE